MFVGAYKSSGVGLIRMIPSGRTALEMALRTRSPEQANRRWREIRPPQS
jgi:hypothetical protein